MTTLDNMNCASQSATLLLLLLTSLIHDTISQASTGEGRIFYLAFQYTSVAQPLPCFQEIEIISPSLDAKVKLVIPALNITQLITLNATNSRANIFLTFTDLALPASSPDGPVAIQITSDEKISVDVNRAEQGSGDGYLALPLTADATEFFIAAYTPSMGKNSIFTILSPYDNTCVDIRLVNGSQSTRMKFMSMKQNEVFNAFSLVQDYTGVYIKSTKPIVVFGGMEDAQVPVAVRYADHIIEQMPPLNEWGTQFIMSSFDGRSLQAGYRFRVVAATNNTIVTYSTITTDGSGNFNGVAAKTSTHVLQRGNWFEGIGGLNVNTASATIINCSNPCLVMQYNTGYEMVKETVNYTDPFMVTVPPLTHYGNNLAFSTSRHFNMGVASQCNNFITIVAKHTDIGLLTLNGQTISPKPPNMWRNLNVPGFSDYSILAMHIDPGFYTLNVLSDPSAMLACYVYGHGLTDWTAYGYLAGYSVDGAGEATVVNSPIYNLAVPNTGASGTGSTVSGQGVPGSGTPGQTGITSSDLAPFIFDWQVWFFALETTGKLISRLCSEGYASYFATKRLPAMSQKMTVQAQTQCAPGVAINMSGYLYYSEYSRGQIKFAVFIAGSSSNTFYDLVQCASNLYNFVYSLSNWVDGPDVDGIEFLQRYTANMTNCAVVHLMPTYMSNYAGGFYCPQYGSFYSAAPSFLPMSLLVVVSVCLSVLL